MHRNANVLSHSSILDDLSTISMTFEYETHSNFLGIRPQAARLDSIAAPEFRKTVVNSSEECKQPIVVDMINVAFMDSSGLGALIACAR